MRVVHFPEFQAQGSIPRRSDKNNEPLSVEVSSLPESARIVFVSQRWLSKESPDDENHTKFNMLVTAVMAWTNQDEKIDLNEVFIWIGELLTATQVLTTLGRLIRFTFLYSALQMSRFPQIFRVSNKITSTSSRAASTLWDSTLHAPM